MIGSTIGTAVLAAGAAAAERLLAAGVVVADPDRDGDVAGEADEPGVVLVVGGAGLAADEVRQVLHRGRGAARHHAFEDGAKLIERRAVAARHHHRRAGLVLDRRRGRSARSSRWHRA